MPSKRDHLAQTAFNGCVVSDHPQNISQHIRKKARCEQNNFKSTLLRSGISVGANVEEGQATQSETDFLIKMSIACKEARETHCWIRLLTAAEIIDINILKELEQEANELVAILSIICRKVKENRT